MEVSLYEHPVIKQEHLDTFFPQYAKEIMRVPVVLGMVQAIKELARAYTLIIVSSAIAAPIKAYADLHNLNRYFTEILGGDHEQSKTKKFHMIFKKYHTSASRCLFVTDTLGDLREAKAAGVPSLAVTWGFHTQETLAHSSPAGFIHTPQEMTRKIKEYFKNFRF